MRDYQTKANQGGAPDSITSTKLGAGEANSFLTENKTAVERAGLTVADADGAGEDTTQLAQAIFINSVKASTFVDSGSANAYQLTPVSGSSGVLLPGGYGALNGMRIYFVPSANNTGNTTINIGQTVGTLLGSKKALTLAGGEIPSGALLASRLTSFTYDASADSGNGAWILDGSYDASGQFLPLTGGAMTGALNMSGAAINEAEGAAIASAATVDLDTATGNFVHITGTTTITAVTLSQGRERTVVFDDALTLTNGSGLVLPGAANIVTKAGDVAIFRGDGSSVTRCIWFFPASGYALKSPAIQGGHKNLKIVSADSGTSSIVTIDAITVEDTNGYSKRLQTVSKTINLANSGANGLDTGSVATSTWYYLWVIAKEDGTVDGLGSTSSTSPTMPSGYTFKALIGAVRTKTGSAVLVGTIQYGRHARLTAPPLPQMIGGASGNPSSGPTFTAVAWANYAPAIASQIYVSLWVYVGAESGAGAVCAPNSSYGTAQSATSSPPMTCGFVNASPYETKSGYIMLEHSTNIYYASNATQSALRAAGWELNL